jgi:hypothetical protein
MVDACRRGDMPGVLSRVTTELHQQSWREACSAFAAHDAQLMGDDITVRGDAATAHVRFMRDGAVHTEDWHFVERDGHWQMRENPPMLMGAWDDDGHHWLGPMTPATPSAGSNDTDPMPSSPPMSAGPDPSVAEQRDAGTPPTMGHDDGEGRRSAGDDSMPRHD